VGLDWHLVHELKITHDSDCRATGRTQQPVIEALASAQAIAFSIKRYCGHDNEFQAGGVHSITHGFANVKFIIVVKALGTVIGHYLKIVAYDTWQIDVLSCL
jgi:hypothetical protein